MIEGFADSPDCQECGKLIRRVMCAVTVSLDQALTIFSFEIYGFYIEVYTSQQYVIREELCCVLYISLNLL